MNALRWCIVMFLVVGFTIGRCSKANDELIEHAQQMEKKYELPTGLLVRICTVESGWRNVLGAAGEIGVCQLRSTTVQLHFPDLSRASTGYFKLGGKGTARVKYRLAVLGYYMGILNDVSTPTLVSKVQQFQKENGLVPDGVIGPKTWEKLMGTPYPYGTLEDKLWNPKINIEVAAMYLKWISDHVGKDRAIMATAYNSGPASAAVDYLKKVLK